MMEKQEPFARGSKGQQPPPLRGPDTLATGCRRHYQFELKDK